MHLQRVGAVANVIIKQQSTTTTTLASL